MSFEHLNYNVSIYGDGLKEYEGYFLVILDEFDEFDNPTQRKQKFYVKAKDKKQVRHFVKHIIDNEFVQIIGNNEKIIIRQIWEVVEVN